eukprot:15365568-Ditylum_brightwellii.AAC.1
MEKLKQVENPRKSPRTHNPMYSLWIVNAMTLHVQIGELKSSIKNNNQLLTGAGEIQQHYLDKSVVQRRSVCCQGQKLHRLRSDITLLVLDKTLKTDSTITKHEGGEDTVAGATAYFLRGWNGLHGEQWLVQKKGGQDMIGTPVQHRCHWLCHVASS